MLSTLRMLPGVVWPCRYDSGPAKIWYVGGSSYSISPMGDGNVLVQSMRWNAEATFHFAPFWMRRHPLALVFQAYFRDGLVRASERSAILSGTECLHERAAVGLATYQVCARQRFHLVCELGVGLIVEIPEEIDELLLHGLV